MAEQTTNDSNLAKLRAIEADIQAGRLREAGAALNAFKFAAPADVRARLAEALLARAQKNPKQEIAALREGVAASPRWLLVRTELAKALSREGAHDEAVTMANEAVALAPEDATTLQTAVVIATTASDLATARRHLETAFRLWPDNVGIGRELGLCLINLRAFDDAERLWRAMAEKDPADPIALGNLGACLLERGEKESALELLERALALTPDDETLKFHLAAARGETPPTQPREMLTALFDGYANRFDLHLVGQLKYRVPRRVAEIVLARSPDRNFSVLDLGCGTGLLGVYLKKIAGAFVGIDVSSRMLQQAAKHGIYTELRQGELHEELTRTPPRTFDYAVANDVFIYVGDLTDVIPAIFQTLRSGGALIFSCESADDSEGAFVLRASKRYAHSRASIEALCRSAGFATCAIEPITVRLDGTVPIPGFIAIAEKR